MAGYLDQYGEGHEQRSQRNKLLYSTLAIVAVLVFLSSDLAPRNNYNPVFRLINYIRTSKHRGTITQFVSLLQKADYTGAYDMWGCTESKPCPDYPYRRFIEDWGPQSANAQVATFEITRARMCGSSGVIVFVDIGKHEERLRVEGSDMTIGYSPWSVCPK